METGISVSSSKMDRVCPADMSQHSTTSAERRGTDRQARVVTRSASDEDHSTTSPHNAQVRLQSSEGDRVRIEVDSTSHGVDDRFGLLVDFLLHKVIERSLHDGGQFDLERLDCSNRRYTIVSTESVDVEFCNRSSARVESKFNEDAPPSAM